ncbi:Trp biosynthesis-associated membrane protein [uncultured Pseudokineococcus sp.]|uniref:Trp biosynthesis-associated membrane protein n=1 Tax=uncultured Pseudokineococcus sp. TaxID=1642928 RepID=UPI002601B509|nr:Trp biosynthesis-associated membrane protein [uncultured Pseudokineococcus sp.]
MSPAGRSARLPRARAVLGLLALGAVVVVSGALTWTRADVDGALAGAGAVAATGGSAAPLVPALGLVALAGAAAASTTRRAGSLVALGVVAAAGAGVVAGAAGVLADPLGATAGEVGQVLGVTAGSVGPGDASATATAWPWVTAGVGALLAVLAVAALPASRAWPSGRRYEAPTARAEELERGVDAGAVGDGGSAGTSAWAGAGGAGARTGDPVTGTEDEGPAAERARRRGEAFDAWDSLSRGEDPTGGAEGDRRR